MFGKCSLAEDELSPSRKRKYTRVYYFDPDKLVSDELGNIYVHSHQAVHISKEMNTQQRNSHKRIKKIRNL